MQPIKSTLPLLSCLLISACSTVQVNHGPFDILPDDAMLDAKEKWQQEPSSGKSDSRPNVLIILVDDLARHDISLYDSAGVSTPNINALARDGICFTSAFTTSPVCSPSRAGLFTGRYQQRFGFERQPMNRYAHNRLEYFWVDHFVNTEPMRLLEPMAKVPKKLIPSQGIPSSEILLSELMKKEGYATGICGKWHLGYAEPFKPNTRGFDFQYGFYEAFSLYSPLHTEGIVEYRHDYFANKHIWRQERKGTCAIRLNDSVIVEDEYLTFSIARRAGAYIREHRDKPFFLVTAFSAPHTPFQVPVEYYNRFPEEQDENRRVYHSMIAALDDAVGMVIDSLKACGQYDNTLIFFASDNGGATYTGATDNGPLKAGKFSQFEGGISIPMIARFPRRSDLVGTYDKPVFLPDIFTTSARAAGISLPSERVYDGVDLVPFLTSPELTPHEFMYWRCDFNRAIRTTDWKLLWNDRDNQVFLYRIDSDSGEQENLSAAYPDVVADLKAQFRKWEEEMKPPMWPGLMEFRFDIDGEETWWAI